MVFDLVEIFLPAITAFVLGILITPLLSHILYSKKMWKKKSVALAIDGSQASISQSIHQDEIRQTPRMGGLIISISVFITAIIFWLFDIFLNTKQDLTLDFISRNQTWIPFFVLLIGALIGLIDDYLEIQQKGGYIGGGLSLSKRLALISIVGLIIGSWFYFKLDVSSVSFLFLEDLYLGIFFIPLFAIVMLAIYSGGVIDGIDGLAGGVFAAIFSSYAFIAFFQNQINIAAFCAVVVGALLAFLWFNIPPARFFLSETGTMGLTLALTVIAFMTDRLGDGRGLLALPIVAAPLIATSFSVIIQLLSKKFLSRKIFIVAPLHHHFQAKGWPPYKVTMRYWVVSVAFAIFGILIALVG